MLRYMSAERQADYHSFKESNEGSILSQKVKKGLVIVAKSQVTVSLIYTKFTKAEFTCMALTFCYPKSILTKLGLALTQLPTTNIHFKRTDFILCLSKTSSFNL